MPEPFAHRRSAIYIIPEEIFSGLKASEVLYAVGILVTYIPVNPAKFLNRFMKYSPCVQCKQNTGSMLIIML